MFLQNINDLNTPLVQNNILMAVLMKGKFEQHLKAAGFMKRKHKTIVSAAPQTSDLTSCCRFLRFFEDLKDMLGFTPYRFYYYMWKYITPILLMVLLCSSLIQLIMTPPSYSAWIQEEVS